ncbi:MAG: DUF1579 domain-containing protein [Candidatus Zixiibacteriota bacterium]|nr:MAG: DUF1579 domain-containing protein [candidate division Zixibacteria bacterium]
MRLKRLLPYVIAAALAISAVWVIAQEGEEMTPEQKEMMELMMKYGTPGEGHKLLEAFIGEWNVTARWRSSPDAPVDESEGTSRVYWILDGRYLMEKYNGRMGEIPFEGMGIVGYDIYAEEYNSLWIDSYSTGFFMQTGTANEDGTIITLRGTYDDFYTGQKDKKSKTVLKIIDKNKHTTEMFDTTPDGKEYGSMELTYTRK